MDIVFPVTIMNMRTPIRMFVLSQNARKDNLSLKMAYASIVFRSHIHQLISNYLHIYLQSALQINAIQHLNLQRKECVISVQNTQGLYNLKERFVCQINAMIEKLFIREMVTSKVLAMNALSMKEVLRIIKNVEILVMLTKGFLQMVYVMIAQITI